MINQIKSKKKSLKVNVIFNAFYQVLMILAPFVTSPYISRVLLPEGQGSYSYAFSLVSYFVLLANYGFLNYGTVLISKERDNKKNYSKLFWELFLTKTIWSLTISIIFYSLVLGNVFFSKEYTLNSNKIYFILGLSILSCAFDLTFLFQGLENFISLCVRNSVIKLLNIFLIFLFVRDLNDYFLYVLIMTLSTVLSAASTLLAIPHNICKAPINFSRIVYHLKKAYVFFIPSAAVSIYTTGSKTILGLIAANPNANGYYDAADKVVVIVCTIISSLNTIIMSRMAYLYKQNDQKKIQTIISKVSELYMIVAFPCFFGLLVINSYFTPAFFGNAYLPTIPLVFALAPRILIVPISNILMSVYFIPNNKNKTMNILLIIGALFNFCFSSLLTYFFEELGCSIGSTLTELLVSTLYIIFSKKDVNLFNNLEAFWKTFDASLLMFIICYICSLFLKNSFSNLTCSIILIIVGSLIYSLLLLVFKEKMVLENLALIKRKLFPDKKIK